MKAFHWFVIYFSLTLTLTLSKFQDGEEIKAKFKNLIDVLEKIMENNTKVQITTVNIFTNVNKHSTQYFKDLEIEIFQKLGSKVTIRDVSRNDIKSGNVDQKWNFNILIVDTVERFKMLYNDFSHESFDYGGFYIIIYEKANRNDVKLIFKLLWDLYIYNVNFMRKERESIIIESFFPFSSLSGCNQTEPVMMTMNEKNITIDFFPEKMDNFNNCSIKITTFESIGPAVLRENYPNGTFRLHGRDIFMMSTIAKKLNFYQKIFYNESYGAWGTLIMNGSASGAFNEAKLRITDVTIGNLNLKIERAIYLGYTLPYAADIFIFIIPPGRPLSSFEKLLHPFDLFVWIALGTVLIIGVAILAVLEKCAGTSFREIFIGIRLKIHT